MAKYSEFKYNSGTKYGTDDAVELPATTAPLTWVWMVDWNNDGVFDGTNDAENMKFMPAPVSRGRNYYVAGNGGGFEPFQVGRYSIALESVDGAYDPFTNANVRPGRKCQLSVYDNTEQEIHKIFTGYIEDVRPQNDTSNTVIFDVVDGMDALNGNEVSTEDPKYRLDISTAIRDVLTQAGWKDGRLIDDCAQPLVTFALDSDDAGRTLSELANASLGNFFIDKNGNAVYYSRSQNSQTTHTIDQSQCLKSIPTTTPWENIRNDVAVTATKPFKGHLESMTSSITPIRITAAGGAKTITFDLGGDWVDVVYEGTESSTELDGSGASLDYWMTTDYTIGKDTATFTFTTEMNGYIFGVNLKGRQMEPKSFTFREEDSTSQTEFKPRRFLLESEYLQSINYAESFAGTILAELKDESKAPTFVIEGRPDIQFDFELLDKVAFTSATLGIDETFYIGHIEHRPGSTLQTVQTTIVCQPLIYDTTSIDDDPYDPGLPEIPEITIPGGGGTGIEIPPPVVVLPDCLLDEAAVQNGPYGMFGGLNNDIRVGMRQDLPYLTGVRMADADHNTYLTLEAKRQIWVAGRWVPTSSTSFYEIWAIDSAGGALFRASDVISQGDYITATFTPSVGTIVAGFRILVTEGPEYTFDAGYTFDFDTGRQGWECAPTNASYPLGACGTTTDGPYSYRDPYDPKYWSYGAGALETRCLTAGTGSLPTKYNCWVYRPASCYCTSASEILCQGIEDQSFSGFGVYADTGVWYGANVQGYGALSTWSALAPAGTKVDAFVWHMLMIGSKWQTLDYITMSGFNATSNEMRLLLKGASISNICEI